MSFFSKAFKAVKSVTHNKLFQAAAGGLAVAFPVVGVPVAAGIAVANKVSNGINAVDPKIRAQAIAAAKNTAELAKKGDVPAKRAVALMRLVHTAKQAGHPNQQAAQHKLSRLLLIDKTRQAKAKQVVGNFAITRGGRIMHKKTRRNLAAGFR